MNQLFPPYSSTSIATSRTITGISVTGGDLVVVAVNVRENTAGDAAGPPDPQISTTFSGTWSWSAVTYINTVPTNRRTTRVFYAVAPQSSTGNITISDDIQISRWKIIGASATGYTTPLAQSAANRIAGTTTPSLSLPASPASGALCVSILATTDVNGNATPGTGWTEVSDTADGTGATTLAMAEAVAVQTASWTSPDTVNVLMILEFPASAAPLSQGAALLIAV